MIQEDDMSNEELELYRQQIEEEFFEASRRGESLMPYLYLPHLFLTEKVKAELDRVLIEEAYKNLFVNQAENWTIYDDGYMVSIMSDPKLQKELLEKMIAHFVEKEEYEKCSIVRKELTRITQTQ